jgi:hypothetical protein
LKNKNLDKIEFDKAANPTGRRLSRRQSLRGNKNVIETEKKIK